MNPIEGNETLDSLPANCENLIIDNIQQQPSFPQSINEKEFFILFDCLFDLFFHVLSIVEKGQKSKSFLFEKNSPKTKTKGKTSDNARHKIGGIDGDFEQDLIHVISIRAKS